MQIKKSTNADDEVIRKKKLIGQKNMRASVVCSMWRKTESEKARKVFVAAIVKIVKILKDKKGGLSKHEHWNLYIFY